MTKIELAARDVYRYFKDFLRSENELRRIPPTAWKAWEALGNAIKEDGPDPTFIRIRRDGYEVHASDRYFSLRFGPGNEVGYQDRLRNQVVIQGGVSPEVLGWFLGVIQEHESTHQVVDTWPKKLDGYEIRLEESRAYRNLYLFDTQGESVGFIAVTTDGEVEDLIIQSSATLGFKVLEWFLTVTKDHARSLRAQSSKA